MPNCLPDGKNSRYASAGCGKRHGHFGGTADQRTVTLGQRQGEFVVVTQGVAAGARVIVAGQLAVSPGGKPRWSDIGGSSSNVFTPAKPKPLRTLPRIANFR